MKECWGTPRGNYPSNVDYFAMSILGICGHRQTQSGVTANTTRAHACTLAHACTYVHIRAHVPMRAHAPMCTRAHVHPILSVGEHIRVTTRAASRCQSTDEPEGLWGPPSELHGIGHYVLEAIATVAHSSYLKWVPFFLLITPRCRGAASFFLVEREGVRPPWGDFKVGFSGAQHKPPGSFLQSL